jgi:D-alanyl-D-alanine carboxypeptidase
MQARNLAVSRRVPLCQWLLVALFVGTFASYGLAGSPVPSDEIERLITDFMADARIPGLSIGVLKDGKVALARGFGIADLESGMPASENTIYPLGSLTKQITAAGVMLLVQSSRLSLDDAVASHVDGTPPGWRGITIRQLLNHTSGIPDFVATPDFARLSTRHHSPAEILKWVAGSPLDFPPGEGWKYSNTNYFLLGLVIESVSGDEYGAFVARHILKPLQMSSTRLDRRGHRVRNRANGYVWRDGKLGIADRPDPSVAYSAGGLVGTVVDFMKWQQALEQSHLLSRATLSQMWAPTRIGDETHPYGFGWRIHGKQNCVSHSGHVQGAAAFMASCPARKFGVVLLANLEGADLEPLSGRIAELFNRP